MNWDRSDGSSVITNKKCFYRKSSLAKHKLLTFTLKKRCQLLSSSFNCPKCNRRGCWCSEQARTEMWKPNVLYYYYGKFTESCGLKPTKGCRRLEIFLFLQAHSKVPRLRSFAKQPPGTSRRAATKMLQPRTRVSHGLYNSMVLPSRLCSPSQFLFSWYVISCWHYECVLWEKKKIWAPVVSRMSALCILLR